MIPLIAIIIIFTAVFVGAYQMDKVRQSQQSVNQSKKNPWNRETEVNTPSMEKASKEKEVFLKEAPSQKEFQSFEDYDDFFDVDDDFFSDYGDDLKDK